LELLSKFIGGWGRGFDILVDSCLLLELKAVEALHPFSKAQLFSSMKVVDVPVGLLINFHQPVRRNGISG
jgi:GxxExxY protein